MRRRALALFSGGLDSILAVKVIEKQGVEVLAINFTSPFFGCSPVLDGEPVAARYARHYNIPFRSVQLGDDFLEMLRNPMHGYGSAMNPCIDCKIFMLGCAGKLMRELEADFVITGEVLGQRPMSQRRDALRVIERDCGLEGLLLRPLSAGYMKVTVPEAQGWVRRDELPTFKGRGRKDQIRLAVELGVDEYPAPGGGCLLTEESYIPKVKDILLHQQNPEVRDFHLLRTGRHFRLSDRCKAVVGRDISDNEKILAAAAPGEAAVRWLGGGSPMLLLVGEPDASDIELAGRIVLRYTKAPKGDSCPMSMMKDGRLKEFTAVNDMGEDELERLRL